MTTNLSPQIRIWFPVFIITLLIAGCTTMQPEIKSNGQDFNELFAEVEIEREVLDAINAARRPLDLIEKFDISEDSAKEILVSRDRLRLERGLVAVQDLRIDPQLLDRLRLFFRPRFIGKWKLLPYQVQSPNGTMFSTAHAAVLRNGKVIFLPRSDTTETVLWNPTDEVTPQFTHPAIQPTEWLFCSGHTFLGDGRLLAVGGGGNSSSGNIDSGWLFNPTDSKWEKSADTMEQKRWYPTALTLGDGRVFVASGYGRSKTEIYNPSTDTFTTLTGPAGNPSGADRNFPETYPGLHLMPRGELFYSRTGWHGPNEPSGPTAMFKFTGPTQGEWTNIASPMNAPDRTEGMSVILLDGYKAKVMTVGGGAPDASGRNSAETIDWTVTPPAYSGHPVFMPDSRLNVNAVLLPDGQTLVVGGRDVNHTPALLYNTETNSFRNVARINYRREYHSVAALLPNGKVFTTGGDYGNTAAQRTSIEIYEPPYLHQKTRRPKITRAPKVVAYGQTFNVVTPEAAYIDDVVFMRPMAVTHHTDTEQRRVALSFSRDGRSLKVSAPPGNRRNIAPPGFYMIFLLREGVPSEAKFVRLVCPKLTIPKIDFELVSRITDFTGNVRVTATVENVGTDFEGGQDWPQLILYEDDREVGHTVLGGLPEGEGANVSFERRWNASSPGEGEFPPAYLAAVVFGPDQDLTRVELNPRCWKLTSRFGSDINNLFRK